MFLKFWQKIEVELERARAKPERPGLKAGPTLYKPIAPKDKVLFNYKLDEYQKTKSAKMTDKGGILNLTCNLKNKTNSGLSSSRAQDLKPEKAQGS